MKKISIFLLMISLVVLLCSCGVSEVVERTGMTKSEIQEAYDVAEALLNDEEYLEAMYKFERISGFKDAEDKANLAYEKYCSDILAAAEKLAEKENYVEAINVLTDALNEVGEEERFINYGLELRETYMKKIISLVDTYVAENNFDSAYAVLESLEEFVGEDEAIDAKLIEIKNSETAYNKNNLMTLINDFDGSDNKSLDAYEEIIYEIEAQLDIIGNDPEIAGIITKYKNAYCDAVLAEAENAFDKNGYEEAIRIIKIGLNTLPDQERFITAIADYESYRPISLSEFDIFVDNRGNDGWYYEVNTATDNLGVKHTDIRAGFGDIVYLIDGYSKLSGVFFQRYEFRSEKGQSTLAIYGDGNILYEATMGPGMKPDYFDIDISGVKELRIVFSMKRLAAVKGYSGCYAAIGDLTLKK